jgi:hypothetical protein
MVGSNRFPRVGQRRAVWERRDCGVHFSLDAESGAGELVGLKLAFNVHSSSLTGAAIGLLGSEATGDGLVRVGAIGFE